MVKMLAKKLKMRTSKKNGKLIIRRKKAGSPVVLRVVIPKKFLSDKGKIRKDKKKAYQRFRAKHIKRAQLKVQARLNKKCKSGRAYCGGRAYHTKGSKRCCPKGGKAAVKKDKKGAYARVGGRLVRLVR
jgi:hypothetical protein